MISKCRPVHRSRLKRISKEMQNIQNNASTQHLSTLAIEKSKTENLCKCLKTSQLT